MGFLKQPLHFCSGFAEFSGVVSNCTHTPILSCLLGFLLLLDLEVELDVRSGGRAQVDGEARRSYIRHPEVAARIAGRRGYHVRYRVVGAWEGVRLGCLTGGNYYFSPCVAVAEDFGGRAQDQVAFYGDVASELGITGDVQCADSRRAAAGRSRPRYAQFQIDKMLALC